MGKAKKKPKKTKKQKINKQKNKTPVQLREPPVPAWPGCVTVSRVSSHPRWPGRAGPKVRVSAGVGQTKGKKEREDPWGGPWF